IRASLQPHAAALYQRDKPRKRSRDVVAIQDTNRSICTQRRHGERHGNAMIAMGVDSTTAKAAGFTHALDTDTIGAHLMRNPQHRQAISHGLDTVAFLDSQLL